MDLITIKPLDTLFLGTNKGFSTLKKTELDIRNNWYPTSLMPLPSVFYGCIATLYIKHNQNILETYNRKEKNKKYIKLGRMYLNTKNNRCVNLPYNFYEKEKSIEKDCNEIFLDNLKNVDNSFVDVDELYSGYENEPAHLKKIYTIDEFFKKSYTVNISMQDKKVIDNRLYRKDVVNPISKIFNGISIEFKIEQEQTPIEDKGFLLFGGEKKLCEYNITRSFKPKYNYLKEDAFNSEWVRIVAFSPLKISKNLIKDFAHSNVFDKNCDKFMITKKPIILHSFYLKNKEEALQAGTVLYIKNKDYKNMTYKEVYTNIYEYYFSDFYNKKSNTYEYVDFNYLDCCKDGFNIFDIFECDLEDN